MEGSVPVEEQAHVEHRSVGLRLLLLLLLLCCHGRSSYYSLGKDYFYSSLAVLCSVDVSLNLPSYPSSWMAVRVQVPPADPVELQPRDHYCSGGVEMPQ